MILLEQIIGLILMDVETALVLVEETSEIESSFKSPHI